MINVQAVSILQQVIKLYAIEVRRHRAMFIKHNIIFFTPTFMKLFNTVWGHHIWGHHICRVKSATS